MIEEIRKTATLKNSTRPIKDMIRMAMKELGIEFKSYNETLVASIRTVVKERKEMQGVIDRLNASMPENNVLGPTFCIFHFITSIKEGYDVEIGFPVTEAVENGEIITRLLPKMDVMSIVHEGPVEKKNETYGKLYEFTGKHGLISDEFAREVFIDSNDPVGGKIEIHFIIHDWNRLLLENVERVLGKDATKNVIEGNKTLALESSVDDRFQWVKCAMEKIDEVADKEQKYDILSSCAHVFPKEQIAKLREIYVRKLELTEDSFKAIDAVIEFMENDPGWGKKPFRNGSVIISSKNPRDAKGYEKAENKADRRKAYCFCPLVRNNLGDGMSDTFCYCGAGWYRQQWEGVFQKKVKVDIIKSVLRDDDFCQFAIYIPEDL